ARRARPLPCTTTVRTSTHWSPVCARHRNCLESEQMDEQDDGLRELYQEVIFDHNRNPRNFHAMTDASHRADGHNPLCGDQLTVYVRLNEGVIQEASFVGHGCAISTASASLMTEAVK